MKNNIYLLHAAETDINGCTILPEYRFDTFAFSTLEKAAVQLKEWAEQFVEDYPNTKIRQVEEDYEDYIIEEQATTGWGEEWDRPVFRFWIEEVSFEE